MSDTAQSPAAEGESTLAHAITIQLEPPDVAMHTPAVSSPLNPTTTPASITPDAAPSTKPKKPPPPVREQRERKESSKKREARGIDTTRTSTPDSQPLRSSKMAKTDRDPEYPELQRLVMNPKQIKYEAPSPPTLLPGISIATEQYYKVTEQ